MTPRWAGAKNGPTAGVPKPSLVNAGAHGDSILARPYCDKQRPPAIEDLVRAAGPWAPWLTSRAGMQPRSESRSSSQLYSAGRVDMQKPWD